MDSAQSLTAAIEFSVGLAGFSGLIFVIRGGGKDLGLWNSYRTLSLVLYAFAAAFGSFLALIFASYLQEPFNWQVSSALLSLILSGLLAFNLNWVSKSRKRNIPLPQSPGYRLLVTSYFLTMPAAILMELANSTGFFPGNEFPIFYSGVVFILFWGAQQFIQMLIRANEV